MATRTTRPTTPTPTEAAPEESLRTSRHCAVPLRSEQLDAVLARAESEGMSHLEFLRALIGEQADQRRERSIAYRIRDACFAESKTLADFDWLFNAGAIDRVQIETLAEGEFIGRKQNLVMVGQSGVGKSHIIQAIGQQACVLGYRVRYTTSALLLNDLTASLADQTLPRRLRYYANFDLVILDEFGFDRIERTESPQAASLLYKLINARSGAIDGVGVEHRFRRLGRLPGRSAAGDGVPGPDRGWGDHSEDQRQVVSSPPGAAGVFRKASEQVNRSRSPGDVEAPGSALLLFPWLGWNHFAEEPQVHTVLGTVAAEASLGAGPEVPVLAPGPPPPSLCPVVAS